MMSGAVQSGNPLTAGNQMPIFISNLKIASGFSLLAFVPVPPKILYWVKHYKRFLQLFVTDPLLLRRPFGVPGLFSPSRWQSLSYSNVKSIIKLPTPLAFPIYVLLICLWFVCVFTVQILIPMGLPLLVLLAPIAFLVKMEALPPVYEVGQWPSGYWLTFLGTLNQSAKVWSIADVEQVASMTIMNNELQTKGRKPKPLELLTELSCASVEELGLFKACVLGVSLDAAMISKIFGRFLVFDPEGEDEQV